MKYLKNTIAVLLFLALVFSGVYAHISHVDKEKEAILAEFEKYKAETNAVHKQFAEAIERLDNSVITVDEFKRTVDMLINDINNLLGLINLNRIENNNSYSQLSAELQILRQNYEAILLYMDSLRKDVMTPENKHFIKQMLHTKCLFPSVRITVYANMRMIEYDENGKERDYWEVKRWCSGSGTIIKSGFNPKTKEINSYILTADHLRWGMAEGWVELHHFEIEIFDFKGSSQFKLAKLVNGNHMCDLMMLQIEDYSTIYPTATLVGEDKIDNYGIFDEVLNVGCGLGIRPYPAFGIITGLYLEYNAIKDYWQVSAPVIYGNSGGGVFDMQTGELLGVVSMGGSHRGVMQNHMAFIVSPKMIYNFLKEYNLEYVLEK